MNFVSAMSTPVSASPIKKNKHGQIITLQQQTLIVNLYNVLVGEHSEYSLTHIIDEISTRSGIGIRTTRNILNEYIRTGTVIGLFLVKFR